MRNSYEINGEVTTIFLKSKRHGNMETIISTNKLNKMLSLDCNWYASLSDSNNEFYVRTVLYEGRKKTLSLQRFLMDSPNNLFVDHINRNTLDNTDGNLRIVTQAQNNQNKKEINKSNKSGYRGVSWCKALGKWRADITVMREKIYLGLFEDINEAHKAVVEARKIHMPYAAN